MRYGDGYKSKGVVFKIIKKGVSYVCLPSDPTDIEIERLGMK